jgi:hypothetical protein
MNTNETHNGWSNRETWLVNLWLTNEPAHYDACVNASRGTIEDYVDELISANGETSNGFMADLINAALARVDWAEIVESMKAE